MPTKTTTKVPKKPAVKKVAAKKAAVKKLAAKTVASKKVSKPKSAKAASMVCAEGENCFWMNDGTILRDLTELATAFGSMADTVFVYHVTPDRNDFAVWVEEVLEDAACAFDLRACSTPKRAAQVVRRHIKLYII